MKFRKVRVFVGNLPPDVSEEDVKKKLKKYAICNDVELKHRQDGSTFAFANLEDSPNNIDKCFEQVPAKQWNGYQITIQLAKESFLQRLQKERETQKTVVEVCNGSKSDIMHRFENFSNVWKDDPAAEKLTKKHFFNSKDQHKNNNCVSQHIKREKAFTEIERHGRESVDALPQNSSFDEQKRKDSIPLHNGICGSFNEGMKKRVVSDIMKEKSENKRLKSIEEQYKSYIQKKQVVKSALANINVSNQPNKKIIFEENEEAYNNDRQKQHQNVSNEKEDQKMNRLILFDEDDEDKTKDIDDEDFRIRNHFEGKKGQKLLELQAKYGNDPRFRLNERFYESDGEHADETEVPKKQTQTEEEKYTMLQVLKNVLGDEFVTSRKATSKPPAVGIMKRFDPTNCENSTLEIKRDGMKKKKKKALPSIDIDEMKESVNVQHQSRSDVNETLPEVSKERFYQVSDTLKDVLGRKEKFSLLEMFNEDGEEEKEQSDGDEAKSGHEAQPIQQKIKWNLDPFKYDSSDGEEEEKNKNPEGESLVEKAVKREMFFFLVGDDRFQEGIDFIRSSNEQESLDTEKIRQIKNTVKHKVKLMQRENYGTPFKRKRK